MDLKTGAIIDGDETAIDQIKMDLGRDLFPISKRDIKRVRAMSMDDRRAYANRVTARRKKSKAAKASKRKNR